MIDWIQTQKENFIYHHKNDNYVIKIETYYSRNDMWEDRFWWKLTSENDQQYRAVNSLEEAKQCCKEHLLQNKSILEKYEEFVESSRKYPLKDSVSGLMYVGLKLTGEAGEFTDHVAKAIRDDNLYETTELTEHRKELLKKELGDVLWYVTAACKELNTSLSEIIQMNIKKLEKRISENKLGGSGDER